MRTIALLVLAGLLVAAATAVAAPPGGTVVTELKVREMILGHVKEKCDALGIDVRVKRTSYRGDLIIPAGTVSYEFVSPTSWEGAGDLSLALIVRVDDRVVKNIPVRVETEVFAEMVITTRPMEAGEILGDADVAIERREMAPGVGKVCRNRSDVIGKKLRVRLRGSAPVRLDQLEKVQVVKSGQLVTILAENETVRASATGKSRSSAAAGETITVQNVLTQREMPATVVDGNTVKVGF